jgi:hypothetical protein
VRRLALLGALAALTAAVVATGASAPAREQDAALARLPAAGSFGRPGLAAAAAWLSATGRASAVVAPGGARPGPGSVWLLAAPAAPVPREEAEAFLAHAAAGGLAVWALGSSRQPELAALLGAARLPGQGERTVGGLEGPLAGLALRAGGPGVASSLPGARPATGPGAPPAAVVVPVGRGEVLLLASPAMLANAAIGDADQLSLWVRLAARGPIAFDERWLRPAAAGAPLRLPLLAGLQALLAAGLLLLGLGRRHGAVRAPAGPASRRTARDYLEALAALARRAGAEAELAGGAWRRLRGTVERTTGVAARLPGEEAAGRLEARRPAAAEALRRGEAALRRSGRGQLLAVTRAAADVEAALRHHPPRQQRGLHAPPPAR